MNIKIYKTKKELGAAAAKNGAKHIQRAIAEKGMANIILATGASQFEMLDALVEEELNWSKVNCFHLDEYIGIPKSHPASFRKYLKERFADKVDIREFNYINGEEDPLKECERLNKKIGNIHIDVAFIGIGENGHLAFNDPPANFEIDAPYIVVELDEACKKQQMGEGWFSSLEEVPKRAISMSIKQLMKSEHIICSVPDQRKAMAVKDTVGANISPNKPSSILQRHESTWLYLDKESASLL